jgi:hypothetical protein
VVGSFGGDGKYDSFGGLRKLLAERPLNIATEGFHSSDDLVGRVAAARIAALRHGNGEKPREWLAGLF